MTVMEIVYREGIAAFFSSVEENISFRLIVVVEDVRDRK